MDTEVSEAFSLLLSRRLSVALGVGALIVFLVIGLVWRTGVAASADRSNPIAVYNALAEDAALGDERAIELKDAIDRYLSKNGLSVTDLGPAVPSTDYEQVGLQRFRLEGVPAWDVRVLNDTEIRSEETFTAYAALREAALRSLVDADAMRVLEIVVTPDRVVGVEVFLSGLGCTCDVLQVTADIFADGVWVMSAGGEFTGVDASLSANVPEHELRAEVATLSDLYPDLDADHLEVAVHSVRLQTTAHEASQLAGRPGVLLVDPITDTADLFGPRAAHVSVSNTPDVFDWYGTEKLGLVLTPTSIVPTSRVDP